MRIVPTSRSCDYLFGLGDELPPHAFKKVRVFAAVDGERAVGCIRIEKVGTQVSTSSIWVENDSRRKGIGTKLYEVAARTACEVFHRPLESGHSLTRYSDGFWRKQYAKRRARCLERMPVGCAKYRLSCPAPETLEGIRRSK